MGHRLHHLRLTSPSITHAVTLRIDLTPWPGSSLDFIPTYDGPHHDRDVVRICVWNEGILHRARWISLGGRLRLRCFEIPVLQTASEVGRHE